MVYEKVEMCTANFG